MAWWQGRGVILRWWWWYLLRFLSNKRIISMATFSLLGLGSSPSLPLMFAKASLVIFEERLMRLMNTDSLVGDKDRMFMKSWHFWKASHRFCWWCNFWVDVFFAVFLFWLFLFSPILFHQSVLRYFSSVEVDYRPQIRIPHGGFVIYQFHLLFV